RPAPTRACWRGTPPGTRASPSTGTRHCPTRASGSSRSSRSSPAGSQTSRRWTSAPRWSSSPTRRLSHWGCCCTGWCASRPVAPAAGAGAYLGWVQLRFGDWLLPLRIQRRHNLRGSFANPITTLDHATRGLLDGHEVGTGLHVPWAVLLAVLVVISFRRWPLSYGAFAAAMLAAGISSSN